MRDRLDAARWIAASRGQGRAHWGIDDPTAVEGPRQPEAFATAMRRLESRIAAFLAIPADAADLPARLREIGAMADPDDG